MQSLIPMLAENKILVAIINGFTILIIAGTIFRLGRAFYRDYAQIPVTKYVKRWHAIRMKKVAELAADQHYFSIEAARIIYISIMNGVFLVSSLSLTLVMLIFEKIDHPTVDKVNFTPLFISIFLFFIVLITSATFRTASVLWLFADVRIKRNRLLAELG